MATHTFSATGGWESWKVPLGITQVFVDARGAGSGTRPGGRAAGTVYCNPGDILWINPGKAGKLRSGPADRNGGTPAHGGGGQGGDGRGSGEGGNGGGGATVVVLGSKNGTPLVVAGGAGGNSGDGGLGGVGGGEEAADGAPGSAGSGNVFDAKGGTQKNPGNGGSSGAGKSYAGQDAEDGNLGRGGAGATVSKSNAHGGGGGGGGWTAGGGGQASAIQDNPGGAATRRFPGGGGGGGSNYVAERLTSATSQASAGGTGDGQVILTWSNTPYTNVHPLVPTNIIINGAPESPEMATSSMGTVAIVAQIDDANIGQKISLLLQLFHDDASGNSILDSTRITSLGEQAINDRGQNGDPVSRSILLTGLQLNTLYRGRLYTVDETGQVSVSTDPDTGITTPAYNAISFWTNRPPNVAKLTAPGENSQIPQGTDIAFEWDYSDPDGGNTQGKAWHRYRTARQPGIPAGPWITSAPLTEQTLTIPGSTFRGNTLYEWSALTADPEGYSCSSWSLPRSFYITAETTPPQLLSPIGGSAVEVGGSGSSAGMLAWLFRDLSGDRSQAKADLRYRARGSDAWVTLYGDTTNPGGQGMWPLERLDLRPYVTYQWEVRTYTDLGDDSDWSEPEIFRAIPRAGSALSTPLIRTTRTKAPLGSGNNRAFIYDRGGAVPRGELTGSNYLQWIRRRDDAGSARIVIDSFDDELLSLLEIAESWQHEMVIFRENGSEMERVFEGPINYISDEYDSFEIQALDVMGYARRRALRQGYNDSYQVIDDVQVGLRTVVERAELMLQAAFAYDDPNLLAYLTMLHNTTDARESRSVPDFSATVFDEIDSLASNAGLDYTSVGRRIVAWDTHQPIGRLPEMRNSDFLTSPRLTQYGMEAATLYAVTDGSGIYGYATRGDEGTGDGVSPTHGALEMVASAYGATEGVSVDPDAMTSAEIAALEETFASQAERNIAHRWPVPWEVRVPENARLSPECGFGINQLVPGVWVPVRAKSRVRSIAQWQKIDQVTMTQTPAGEQIAVVMNPAPNGGRDPDAESVEDA